MIVLTIVWQYSGWHGQWPIATIIVWQAIGVAPVWRDPGNVYVWPNLIVCDIVACSNDGIDLLLLLLMILLCGQWHVLLVLMTNDNDYNVCVYVKRAWANGLIMTNDVLAMTMTRNQASNDNVWHVANVCVWQLLLKYM